VKAKAEEPGLPRRAASAKFDRPLRVDRENTCARRRAGPRSIQIEWTDDPYADTFRLERNGATLISSTKATSVVDSSFLTNAQYCYQVFGFDSTGHLVSASEEVCIVV
jgi:hypothetical protein